MGNILRVLKRDGLRLLRTPQALVVCVALLVLPSLYTWYNVLGFWDPYNNTGGVRVCIVNEDEGGSSELTGPLDLGSQIVEQLKENDQLDWYFTDEETALSQVSSGQAYAAIVIPKTFTANLLTLVTGDFVQPKLQYYVNEKAGPVAPKITDTGVNTLDETINSTFVATVSNVVASSIDEASAKAEGQMSASKDGALSSVADAKAKLLSLQEAVSSLQAQAAGAAEQAEESRSALDGARASMGSASERLGTVSHLTSQLSRTLSALSGRLTDATAQSLSHVADLGARAADDAARVQTLLGDARSGLDAGVQEGRSLLANASATLDELDGLAAQLPEGSQERELLVEGLERQRASLEAAFSALDDLESQISASESRAEETEAARQTLSDAARGLFETAQATSSDVNGSTLPAMADQLSDLSELSVSLAAAVGGATRLVDQAQGMLDQLAATLESGSEALGQTDSLLSTLLGELEAVETDVSALQTASALESLLGEDSLNASLISDFMGSPTQLVTEQLYPLNAYGSAMAPLFMNLTFWIGAFMLVVVMRQEVDSEGIRNLKLYQRYLGRFLLMAVMVVLQAVICCVGLLLIGVQAVSVPALFFAAVCTALSYLSIIFALSLTLQHIGKGICVLLVFAQIPGATGLYPVEMTSSFFQAVYPFMPFTYGINALREAICGFYGAQYAQMIAVLGLFFALFLALGLLFRPLLANVNLMVSKQVREGGIYNGEDVQAPIRPYRFSHIVRALADRDEYNRELTRRYERFLRWYPRIIRATVAASIVMPVALFLLVALTPAEKVTLLTIWLFWIVAVFIVVIVVESLRASFERQLRLDHMSEDKLLGLYRRERGAGEGGEGRG